MVAARIAVIDDAAGIEALRQLARSEAAEERGGERFLATEAGVPAEAEHATVVGTLDGDVVGVGTVVRAGDRAFISEIFTHPDVRGVGIGHAVVGAIEEQARSWGCTELESWALPGDRETKNFFESHAMKARLLIVHRSL